MSTSSSTASTPSSSGSSQSDSSTDSLASQFSNLLSTPPPGEVALEQYSRDVYQFTLGKLQVLESKSPRAKLPPPKAARK